MDNRTDWWRDKSKQIATLMDSGASLYKFYTWPPIIATMWPNTDGYAIEQIHFLVGLRDWLTRWKSAIKDNLRVESSKLCPGISPASINHAFNLAHFERVAKVRLNEMDYIFEFGPGTGNMCRIIFNLGFKGIYEIFDLPELCPLQRFFLSESGIDISKVHWLDDMDSANIPNETRRLLISIAAIDETPPSVHPAFIELGKRCTHFLTGGQLLADVHIHLHDTTQGITCWNVWETRIPPGYYIGIGSPC